MLLQALIIIGPIHKCDRWHTDIHIQRPIDHATVMCVAIGGIAFSTALKILASIPGGHRHSARWIFWDTQYVWHFFRHQGLSFVLSLAKDIILIHSELNHSQVKTMILHSCLKYPYQTVLAQSVIPRVEQQSCRRRIWRFEVDWCRSTFLAVYVS